MPNLVAVSRMDVRERMGSREIRNCLALPPSSILKTVMFSCRRRRSLRQLTEHRFSQCLLSLVHCVQEYAMFKKHSQSLLQQEKELNAKLRHLVT